jgi:hypothetical protein
MRVVPVIFVWREVDVWDDDGVSSRVWAMVPLARYAKLADRQYAKGEEHALEPVTYRDMSRHNHYFAALNEAFKNLPETVAARWPTAEHFRKWVLIETGWFEEKEFDFEGAGANKRAKMLGTFIRAESEFARISITEVSPGKFKVIVRRAKSQAIPAMKPEEFYQSKKDVLDYVSGMIGVRASELKKHSKRGAA